MSDAGAFNPGVKVVAHFILIVAMQLAAQKGSDIFRFDSMYGCAGQIVIDAFEILLAFEHDIGGIFGLHDRPMISQVEDFDNRTKALGKLIQDAMDQIHLEPIGNLLGFGEIGNTDKQAFDELMVDASLLQLGGQPAVAIEIDL